MKKTCILLLVPIVTALVIGCASPPPPAAKDQHGNDIPEWFLNPPMTEDAIFGAGTATMSDLNRAKTFAESRARQSIAFTLNANVQAMITDYSREAGNSESKSNLEFTESIGRQLTNAQLSGTYIYKAAYTNGTYFVLIALKKSDAAKQAAAAIESEAAQYAEFKAMDALKRMETQLDKTDIKPKSVDN